MNIRLMKNSDYNRVYSLWLSCKGMGLNDIDDSEQGIRRFLERNPETCFVAEQDNRIAGVILAGNDGRRGYIYHAAVLPEHRRKGIGTALLDTALKALADIGIVKVALVVFERNSDGNAFWEKQGFDVRYDLVYRNKALTDIKRIDT